MAINKEEVQSQLDDAIQKERQWRAHFDKQDHGSYCENPSHESGKVFKVVDAWRDLMSALMLYERDH